MKQQCARKLMLVTLLLRKTCSSLGNDALRHALDQNCRTRDDGDDARVCDAQAAHAKHAQRRVHDGVPPAIGAHCAAAHIGVAAVHGVADERVQRRVCRRARARVQLVRDDGR